MSAAATHPQRCEVALEYDREERRSIMCQEPAHWYIEGAGHSNESYWACESHVREALLYLDATCNGGGIVVDDESGDLVEAP
jgi:hypothetical protein